MKKVLSVLLSICMIISLFPITAYAGSDTMAPEIDASTLSVRITNSLGITSTKGYAVEGDTVKISVRITDDGTIKRAMLQLKNVNSTLGVKNISMEYNSTTRKYDASFKIDKDTEAGNWSVYAIEALDSALPPHLSRLYNSKVANDSLTPAEDLSAADFRVGSDEPEENPPFIDPASVSVELASGRETAKKGDTVTISASITDESTILAAIINIKKPNSEDTIPTIMRYDDETKKYVADVIILSSFTPGEWSVYSIEARDSFSNTATLYNSKCSEKTPAADLSAANFTVETDKDDVTPPDIETASIKSEISSGRSVATTNDTVKFTVKITDDSEIKIATLQLAKPGESVLGSTVNLKYNEETALYEGTMEVKSDTARGLWQVDSVMAIDAAGNTAIIHNIKTSETGVGADLSFADFTVSDNIWEPYVAVYVNGVLCTTPDEVIKIEKGSAVFVAFETDYEHNLEHGYAPIAGFADGYEGGMLSSKGFGVETGYSSQLGYSFDTNMFGAKITAQNLSAGVTGDLDYYMFKFEGEEFNMEEFNFATAEKANIKTLHFEVTDHIWNDGEVTTAATCAADGVKTYTCTACGETKTESIPAIAHTVVTDKAVAATFKAAGKTAGTHCSVCGKVITAQKAVAKLVSPTVSKLTAGKKQFTATWKKAPTVDGYQIQYATNKKFTKAKSVTVKKAATTKTTVKKLKAKQKYFVRVRAYKTINGKKVYSNWSKAKTVTTKK